MKGKKELLWTPGVHSVGNAEMDNQHKIIFSIINKLDSDVNDNLTIKEKIETVNELITYSSVHFDSEETMLKDIDYSDRFNHALLHDVYNKKLVYFLDNIHELDIRDVTEFAQHWWESHILIEDMKYKK